MLQASRHASLALVALLASALGLFACVDDSPVSDSPDSVVLDTSPDAGLDISFDVSDDTGAGDATVDLPDDVSDDAAGDAVTDPADDASDDAVSDALPDVTDDAVVDGGPDAADVAADAVADPDLFVPLGLGEACETSDECESGRCETFGEVRICTAACDASCPVDGLVCFEGLCTPDDFCGTDDDGRPFGPGCPCEGLCDLNATCELVDDVTGICECNPGYDGDGFTCTLRDLPWLRVSPPSIAFGPVGLSSSAFETLTIENVGPEPRRLSDVRLARQPSQGFAIFSPFSYPLEVAPETSATVDVRFRPTVLILPEAEYRNEVIVESDDPAEPAQTVPISGIGVPSAAVCLTFNETTVDFGVVEPGETEAETVNLSNCGTTELLIDVIELFGETESLSIELPVELPVALGQGASIDIVIAYAPSSPAPVQAVLSARTGDGVEAAVRVLGGYSCPIADIDVDGGDLNLTAESRIVGRVGDLWTFDGGGSDDPAGGDLIFDWTLSTPDESVDPGVTPDLASEAFAMVPDAPGRYFVTLSVTSDASDLESCNVARYTADAFPTDPVVVLEVTWNNQADVDLHLVQTNDEGTFPDFGSSGEVEPLDAYFNNLFADFGVIDEPADNAWHQGDDIDGFGPELIELGRFREGRRYRIGVNYARRRLTESVTPTLTITVGEASVASYTTTLTETGYWVPVIVEDDGTLTVVGD